MIQLNYRDAKPIYEQIKDGLRKLVITNSLIANEKLPSVREMASKLAINPNTIQKAYRELEAEGYVYTVAGKGTFVAERKEVLGVRNEELMKEEEKKNTPDTLKLHTDLNNHQCLHPCISAGIKLATSDASEAPGNRLL